MIGQNTFRVFLAASAAAAFLVTVVGTNDAHADACSASMSAQVSRSAGGTCGSPLSLNQEFTLSYRLTNNSIIDDTNSVNDQDPVEATIPSGEDMVGTLAQSDNVQNGTQLPGTLTFVPVCPAGSTGGTKNAGEECDPNLSQCGTGTCGCESNLPGVTCVSSTNNKVAIEFGSDVNFAPDEQLTIATIRVRLTDTVDGAACGNFFTRIDTTGSILVTTDPDCSSEVTAGAQGSADLNAPACDSNDDCGACHVCADIGSNPHCEVAAENTPCDPDAVSCTDDVCDDAGVCVHLADDSACNDDDTCTNDHCSVTTGCVFDFICGSEDICRSPGYWGTHAGTEKNNSVNVAQAVIDAVGGIEVCGQTLGDTSPLGSLDSSTEGICVKVQGVSQRQLYRQLVAAALNCAISGGDGNCDDVTDKYIEVSFEECSDVCAGNPDQDPPSIGDCIAQLDCFNNGGHIVNGECGTGTCSDDGSACNEDADCDQNTPQTCEQFANNCHRALVCNEDIGVCPKKTPAGSSGACREARGNDCTIDSCN